MKLVFNTLLAISAVGLLIFTVVSSIGDKGFGGAPDGTQSRVATSSMLALTTNTATRIFATSTNCMGRIVSTNGTAVSLSFSEFKTDVPTGSSGVYQAGSTTVAYDSSIYGCNAINAYSYATNPIYVMEVR